jgi:hypothetical protein
MVWPLESVTYNLLALQSLARFQGTYAKPLTRRTGLRFYFDLVLIITVAVNWNVAELVTSSWGFLRIVFAAGAGIVWEIYEHFEVHELG